MVRRGDSHLMTIGLLVGLVLIVAGLGTLVTAPWQYHGSTTVTILRIFGTLGTILIGIGLVYLAWGEEFLARRKAQS